MPWTPSRPRPGEGRRALCPRAGSPPAVGEPWGLHRDRHGGTVRGRGPGAVTHPQRGHHAHAEAKGEAGEHGPWVVLGVPLTDRRRRGPDAHADAHAEADPQPQAFAVALALAEPEP